MARRLDRLARRAHAFHRFAHHPLCDQYTGELIALGRRRRVCRGCAYALLGGVTGFVWGVALPLSVGSMGAAAVVAAVSGACAAVSVGRHPTKATTRRARFGKLWTRALPLAGLSFALGVCARLRDANSGVLAFGVLGVVYALYALYRRRGPDRAPCLDCKERRELVPCSGFRDIVRAERAFVRLSHSLLDRAARRG